MRSKEEYSQGMKEEAGGEEGEVETAEEGGEAEAWLDREEAGPGAIAHQKIYQYLLSLSLDNCCNLNCSNYVCSFSHDTALYQQAKLVVNKSFI